MSVGERLYLAVPFGSAAWQTSSSGTLLQPLLLQLLQLLLPPPAQLLSGEIVESQTTGKWVGMLKETCTLLRQKGAEMALPADGAETRSGKVQAKNL